ncbi:MAG: hypothetical protein WC756_10440 [Taibaiella sp.]|jgi:hypothetical protein
MKKLINRIIALEDAYQNTQPLEDEKYLEDCTTQEEAIELFLRKTTMRPNGKKRWAPICLLRANAINKHRPVVYQSKEEQEIAYQEATGFFADKMIKVENESK